MPNEETPLLGGKEAPTTGLGESRGTRTTGAGLSSQNSYTPGAEGRRNAYGGPDVFKKTPLPWAQLSIGLFLEAAEPLSSRVIFPVSPNRVFLPHFVLVSFDAGWRDLLEH